MKSQTERILGALERRPVDEIQLYELVHRDGGSVEDYEGFRDVLAGLLRAGLVERTDHLGRRRLDQGRFLLVNLTEAGRLAFQDRVKLDELLRAEAELRARRVHHLRWRWLTRLGALLFRRARA